MKLPSKSAGQRSRPSISMKQQLTAFSQDIVWDFRALCQTRHDAIPLAWIFNDLDLNSEPGLEYLHFPPKCHSIEAIYRDPVTSKAIPVTREGYTAIIDDVKSLCTGAAPKLVAKLQARFPASTLMDAFGFVYPQYWMSEDADLPLNLHTRLWRKIDASSHLRFSLSEYMKIAELAMVMVLGSVEDERIFSTLSFMKNK